MLGAIIGDIVGSPYEFNNIKTTDFPLFSNKSKFTDDTVMTMAVAEALMEGGKVKSYVAAMKYTDYCIQALDTGDGFASDLVPTTRGPTTA